jgi:hypothetical protein
VPADAGPRDQLILDRDVLLQLGHDLGGECRLFSSTMSYGIPA